MEPFGDDYRQIISLAAPPIEALGEPATTVDLARVANDAMAELVGPGDDRFIGFVAGLPLNDVDATLREIDRAVNDLGALGIQIYTHVNGRPLDDPEFAPVFAKMAELDRPIWVHPSRNSSWPDYPLAEDKSKFEIWWTLGWPYDTSVFMARLAFSGVFERHPDLRVITHHAGGMIPFFSGRVGPGWDQFGARTPDDEAELVDSKLTGRPIETFHKFLRRHGRLRRPARAPGRVRVLRRRPHAVRQRHALRPGPGPVHPDHDRGRGGAALHRRGARPDLRGQRAPASAAVHP